MALNLKVADLYADMKINLATFNAQLAQVRAKLAALSTPTIRPTINTGAAMIGLNALLAKMREINRQSVVTVTSRARTAGGGGGGTSGSGGGAGGAPAFVPLSSVQMSGIKLQDAQRAAAASEAAAQAKAQAAAEAAAARSQAAQDRAAARQVAAADRAAARQAAAAARTQAAQERAAARQAAAADRAAARQEAADARVQAAQQRSAASKAAAAQRSAAAQIAADARVQAAQQRSVASQAAAANRAYAARVAAANRAAAAQIAADARVQAAHQRSVAAQAAAANRAYAAATRAAQRAAAAQAAAAQRAAAGQAAAQAANLRHFGAGLGQGVGLPYLGSPQQAAGLAIGAGLKEGIGTAIDLEAKFAEVRRVAGLSADETARLKKELMEISTVQPGASVQDLIKMAEIGGRMGIAGKDLKGFASSLAMVQNSVSDMETEDLANNMSRVLNVFNLGTDYVKGFGSALTAMDNASTASASDILKITQGLSGTAHAIGLTLPQVIALSASLRDVGLSNAVASSSMSQVFRKMATNSAEFAAAAGVDAEKFADAYRKSPMEALGLLMRRLNETKDTIAAQELLKSLGLEGVRSGGALLQLAAAFEKVGPMAATANGEFTTLKSLLDADALKGETTAAALGKLGNAFTGMADRFIGSPLIPVIKEISNDLTEMTRLADAAATALGGIGSGKGLGEALQGIGEVGVGASRNGAKWLDRMIGDGMIGGPLGIAAKMTGMAGAQVGLGKFNGFQRLNQAIFGAPPAPPAAPGGKPLPAAPPQPLKGGSPEAYAAAAAGASAAIALTHGGIGSIGQAGPAALADKVADPGTRWKAPTQPWGLGAQLGKLGDALAGPAGIAKIAGNSLGQLGEQLAKSLGPKDKPAAAVGLSGMDFGRMQQQQILDTAAKNTEKNTGDTVDILGQMFQLMQRGKNQVISSLLSP